MKKASVLVLLLFGSLHSGKNNLVETTPFGLDRLITKIVYGQIQEVDQILRDNPDLIHCRYKDSYPLSYAISNGHKAIIDLLLRYGADLNAREKNDFTPFFWTFCINKKAQISEKTLFIWIHEFIERGAHVNIQEIDGNTPLHRACYKNYFTIAKLLIENGSNINVLNKQGISPLNLAVHNTNKKMVQLLLDCNANPNLGNLGDKFSCLHKAVRKQSFSLAKLLIESEADRNSKTAFGYTPLDLAVAKSKHLNIIELLIRNGAVFSEHIKNDHKDFFQAYANDLKKHNLSLMAYVDNNISNPVAASIKKNFCVLSSVLLHRACEQGDLKKVESLLKHSRINKEDESGRTPLHIAVANNHVELVKVLISYCAYVNTQDKDGNSPLHSAVQNNNEEMVSLLLANNAHPIIYNRVGKIPINGCRHDAIRRQLQKAYKTYKAEIPLGINSN